MTHDIYNVIYTLDGFLQLVIHHEREREREKERERNKEREREREREFPR